VRVLTAEEMADLHGPHGEDQMRKRAVRS
jgi:hypothetical protein